MHRFILALCLLVPLQRAEGQFLEVTAEVQVNDWDYWFFAAKTCKYPGEDTAPSVFTKGHFIRCIVSTNTWLLEGESGSNTKRSWWFTGTNLVERSMITKAMSEADTLRLTKLGGFAVGAAPIGEQSLTVHESRDGNPGRPVRVRDLMGPGSTASISWLAFCSGSFLKREGRKLSPPSDLWKETRLAFSGWSDQTAVFDDGLGLPKHVSLLATNGQPVFEYQVLKSTNVLGWNFPLEFFAVQYVAHGTNRWELETTIKGRVTSIRPAAPFEIPSLAKTRREE